MTAGAITEFAVQADGTRIRQFEVGDVVVQVRATDRDRDEAAHALAEALHGAARDVVRHWHALESRCSAAEARAAAAEGEADRLRALVPPPAPERLLGPGCVRFRGSELWLLNRRETGWASWGMRCAGWDDLFRRYAVTITGHGIDEHGAYWIATPEGR
jgi:hypothetical protein